jgi:hypothetical protein
LKSEISDLLNRPIEQRVREFRYRCAQSIIFGLPVLALQWLGPRLGGPETPRWIAILQALLAGWIIYVAAAGMLVEGFLARSWKHIPDTLVAILSIGFYLVSLFGIARLFHWVVLLLIVWTALRWAWLVRHSRFARAL